MDQLAGTGLTDNTDHTQQLSVMVMLWLMLLSPPVTPLAPLTEVYSWPEGKVEVDWPNTTWARRYGQLDITVIGIKVWRDKIFVTAPRWLGQLSVRNSPLIAK